MKYLILLFLLIISMVSYSQYITRGPDVGEIYFLGPTGLYYSTDFGETATFIDGTMDYVSIAADKTKGGIYCIEYPINLYYSDEYGNTGTWNFKFSNEYLYYLIVSGVEEGHIFSDCSMHSINYGSDFIFHYINGWFGSVKHTTIDCDNEEIGYAITYKLSQPDSLYLFKTIDTFENVNVIQQWDFHWSNNILLSYGSITGELFLVDFTQKIIWFSNNYGDDFLEIDTFNLTNYYQVDMVGGQQVGELYIFFSYINSLWGIAHIYIYHSIDYGKTFEVFHPYSDGNEPVLANFSTDEKEVHLTTPVEFSNFSIGDIQEYNWDFDNNGTIDSYDESPAYFYQDTGWYSVKLTAVGVDSSNSFIKHDYIHVIDTTTNIKKIEKQPDKIRIFPNPFSFVLTIQIDKEYNTNNKVEIFNGRGEIVYKTESCNQSILWDGCNITGKMCQPGIYYIKTNNSVNKVILTN